jgi:exodeoxyribonuclease V alpha subunit
VAERLVALTGAYQQAASAAEQAKQQVETSDAAIAAEADRLRDALLRRWDSERAAASAAARVVLDGPGRLRLRRGAVARAGEQLLDWADRWRPHVPELPADPAQLAQVAGWFDHRPALWAALDASARRAADHVHPEHDGLRAAAEAAQQACEQAYRALAEARRPSDDQAARLGALGQTSDPEATLADVDHDIAAIRQQLAAARARIAHLTSEPAVLALPADRLAQERDAWRIRHHAERAARRTAPSAASPQGWTDSMRPPEPVLHRMLSPGAGPSIGR